MGGLAYMSYYTSFPAVGICVYLMRTRFGYRSLAEAINERYGNAAAVAFGLVVLYRLFQVGLYCLHCLATATVGHEGATNTAMRPPSCLGLSACSLSVYSLSVYSRYLAET